MINKKAKELITAIRHFANGIHTRTTLCSATDCMDCRCLEFWEMVDISKELDGLISDEFMQ